jgi:isoleucyl-tRNA synthetase
LKKAVVYGEKIGKELQEILMNQLNVKKIEFKEGKEVKVKLDTKITEELETEGYVRELARKIQAERKKAGFKKGELVDVEIFVPKDMLERIDSWSEFLSERTNANELKIEIIDDKIKKEIFNIREKRFSVGFS